MAKSMHVTEVPLNFLPQPFQLFSLTLSFMFSEWPRVSKQKFNIIVSIRSGIIISPLVIILDNDERKWKIFIHIQFYFINGFFKGLI